MNDAVFKYMRCEDSSMVCIGFSRHEVSGVGHVVAAAGIKAFVFFNKMSEGCA